MVGMVVGLILGYWLFQSGGNLIHCLIGMFVIDIFAKLLGPCFNYLGQALAKKVKGA